jgi:hypothetical protein
MRKPANWPAELAVSFFSGSHDGSPAAYLVREGTQEVARVTASRRGRWYWRGWIGGQLHIDRGRSTPTLRDALAEIASVWTAAATDRQASPPSVVPTPIVKEPCEIRIRTLTVQDLVPNRLYLCVASDDPDMIGEIVVREEYEWFVRFQHKKPFSLWYLDILGQDHPRYVPLRVGASVTLLQTQAGILVATEQESPR